MFCQNIYIMILISQSYKSINNVENIMNNIIKYLCCLKYHRNSEIRDNLNKYISKNKLNKYINIDNFININDIDERIELFKIEINKNINLIVYNNLLEYILFSLFSIHKPYFIKQVLIFFDGIPSYSKILEQRRRRIFNYISSSHRKDYYDEYFKDDTEYIFLDKELNIKYNYFKYIKNTFSVNKNFGPESEFIINLSNFLNNKLTNKFKINVYIDDSTNKGEADYKILKHIEEFNITDDISIHSCDSDFLYFTILYQLKINTSILI